MTRLSGTKRRRAILDASVAVFAARGFDRVRTRELAEAAGVSEALLYRHFPSKEALYQEVQKHVHRIRDDDPALRTFAGLQPSTEKLVLGVHLFVSHMVEHVESEDMTLLRLMMSSLVDDGAFARSNLERFRGEWFEIFDQALGAAHAAGDVLGANDRGELWMWLVHHVAFAVKMTALPAPPAIDYGMSRAELTRRTVVFVLRGIGVKEAAIRRYYRPKRLAGLLE